MFCLESRNGIWACYIFFSSLIIVRGWYFPGTAPLGYTKGALIAAKVDELTSAKTQVPLKFYQLPYCQPPVIVNQVEEIGEILKGNFLQNSLFEFSMLQDTPCQTLCIKTLSADNVNDFINAIENGYSMEIWANDFVGTVAGIDKLYTWLQNTVNGLNDSSAITTPWSSTGVPVGVSLRHEASTAYVLTNHWDFIVSYHPETSNSVAQNRSGFQTQNLHTIVDFEVIPGSISYATGNLSVMHNDTDWNDESIALEQHKNAICDNVLRPEKRVPVVLEKNVGKTVAFTFSVHFQQSQRAWNGRWERYLRKRAGAHPKIHWFALANSVIIVLLFSGMVTGVLLRTLLRDIARYNSLEDTENEFCRQEDAGWKLVHGDVFRPPRHGRLLAICAGTGVQVLGMCLLTLLAVTLGVISPVRRGSIVRSLLFLYAAMGALGGYIAVRISRLFEKNNMRRTLFVTYATALFFPGLCFATFFFINFLLYIKKVSVFVDFATLLKLVGLWFGISVPLVFIGAYLAHRTEPLPIPVRTNQIPRQIPPVPWYLNPWILPFITGIFPFCVLYTEFFFIFTSVWYPKFYFLFSFLLITLIIVLITSGSLAVAVTYFLLCAENYRWWWPAFWSSGASSFYVVLYSVYYLYTTLHITRLSVVTLYFGYTVLLASALGLLTGAVGFLCSLASVRVIYAAVKVD